MRKILLILFFLNLNLLFAQESFNNKDSYIKIIKREKIEKKEREKEYTVNLKYTPSLEKFKIFWHAGEIINLKEDIPWKEKVKIPLEESKLTLWGQIHLGDKGIPLKVVVFFPQGFLSKDGLLAEGYKIYIDKDYDNIFEEEEGYICEDPYKVMIDDIDILYKKGRGKYKMSIQVLKQRQGYYTLSYTRRCAQEGVFVIKGKKYQFVLLDEGQNGLYNDFEKGYRQDKLVVIPLKEGILDFDKRKIYPLDSTILLDNSFFKISYVSEDGSVLKLKEAGFGLIEGEVEDLVNSSIIEKAKIVIKSKHKTYFLRSNEQGKFNIKLPEGNYKLAVLCDNYLPTSYFDIKLKANEKITFKAKLLSLKDSIKKKESLLSLSAKEKELFFKTFPSPYEKIGVVGGSPTTGNFIRYLGYDYSFLDEECDFSSLLDEYPVLIIPSGLLSQVDKEKFKAELEIFVGRGGVVFVFSQQKREDFKALPGNLEGVGYLEAQSSFKKSTRVFLYHPVIGNLNKEILDIHTDGYFTKYPENSEIILRLSSNFMPALLIYKYGKGYVIATNFYSPYALESDVLSKDEEILIKNILDWAKCKALNYPVVNLKDSIKIEISSIREISQMIKHFREIQSWVEAFGEKVGMKEEDYKEFQEYQKELEKLLEVKLKMRLENPKGEIVDFKEKIFDLKKKKLAKEIYTYKGFDSCGLWRFSYEVFDKDGNLFEQRSLLFYVKDEKRIKKVKLPDLSFSIDTVISDQFFFGEDVPFFVCVYNRAFLPQEVIVKYWDDNKAKKSGWVKWYGANAYKKIKVPQKSVSGFFFIHRHVNNLRGSAFDAYFYDSCGKKLGYFIKGIQPYKRKPSLKIELDKKFIEKKKVRLILNLKNLKEEKRKIKVDIHVFDCAKNIIFKKLAELILKPKETKTFSTDFVFQPLDSQNPSIITIEAKEDKKSVGTACDYIY